MYNKCLIHSNNELLCTCYIVCTGGTHVYHDTVVKKKTVSEPISLFYQYQINLHSFLIKKYSIKIFI